MILTAAFLICKVLGATWSWWWLALTITADYSFLEYFGIVREQLKGNFVNADYNIFKSNEI